jgi:hypothetical protein
VTVEATDTTTNMGTLTSTFSIDTTAPVLAEVTAVTTPTRIATPQYVFSSTEAGSITYGGSCSSATAVATSGNNTITFNTLVDGTYSGCTITVTDAATNISNTLSVSEFVVNASVPILSEGSPDETLVAGTTETIVSLKTDVAATCKYEITSGVAYGAMANTFTTTGEKNHSFNATALVNGGSYGYFVRCLGSNGNSNLTDYLISFAIANPAVIKVDTDNQKKVESHRGISNSRKSLKNGMVVTERGKKFSKNSTVLLYFSKYGGGYYPAQKIKTSSTGSFMLKYKVNKPVGTYTWYAVDTKAGWKSNTIYYRVKK